MSHRPRKRFGQNFLVDQQVIDRIIAAIAPAPDQLIFEIGPGRQALTRPLAASGADLVVIEIDRDLAAELNAGSAGFDVVNRDALDLDYAELAAGRPYRLVGNLPYNISTPLLFHLLSQQPAPIDMHFMLQAEVVQRMAAVPGGKDYGRLSLTCQNRCEVVPLLAVGAEAFEPRPRVESAFVRLLPRPAPLVGPTLQSAFERLVSQAFSMRRKTLRNSLRSLLDADAIKAVGIDPATRPEQLSIDDFATLARLVSSEKG